MQKGYTPILVLLLILGLGILIVGSFFYLNERRAFPWQRSTPSTDVRTNIDKSNFVKGEILVTFKKGTLYSEASNLFVQYGIQSYSLVGSTDVDPNKVLDITDVFKAQVPEGDEQLTIDNLLIESTVESATLNYIIGENSL